MTTEQRKERDKLITEEFKKTGQCAEVGRKFNLTGERVRQIVGSNNFIPKTIRIKNAQELLTKKKEKLGLGEFLSVNEAVQIKTYLGVKYRDLKEENLKKAALELYKKDKSRKRIAATLGITYVTVSRYLRLQKQTPGCYRKEQLDKRDKEIYTYWKLTGDSQKEIGKKFNTTPQNISFSIIRYKKKNNIKY
jgi:DNA-directed RNA polymerase specialized sigma subunit